jgi:hypothetical protein
MISIGASPAQRIAPIRGLQGRAWQRHNRRALPLLAQARTILRPGELRRFRFRRRLQPEVLRAAGYSRVELLRDEGGMALYAAG